MPRRQLPFIHPLFERLRLSIPTDKIEPPLVLEIEGSDAALSLLERLPDHGLGVVGTRHPGGRSLLETARCIRELAGSQLIIVSGFAKGIDAAAHEAALRNGLPTIAFVGAGLDVDYPLGHGPLRRAIVEAGGLLISELGPDSPPRAGHFHQRNRLIACASNAVWVVEAGVRSGALNTANWARKAGRKTFVTPCFPGDPSLAGNQRLIVDFQASPLWSAYSFGEEWISLSTRPERETPTRGASSAWLLSQIRRATTERGGAWSADLLERFLVARSGSPQDYFDLVDALVSERLVLDRGGVLASLYCSSRKIAPHQE